MPPRRSRSYVARKPTIIIIPGAWYTPVHYAILIGSLRAAEYPVVTAKNASCDSSHPDARTVAFDAATIRNGLLLPQILDGREVVLVMHSYGGIPGNAAAQGLSLPERRDAGHRGGIIGLIMLSAFIALTGESLVDCLAGQPHDEWLNFRSDGQLGFKDEKRVFFHDVPSPVDQSSIVQLRHQALTAMTSPTSAPAWADRVYDDRRAYLYTTADKCVLPYIQSRMIEKSQVNWMIQQLDSGHSPFLSRTEEVSAWIIQMTQLLEQRR